MNLRPSFRPALLLVVSLLLGHPPDAPAGRPGPWQRNSPGRRQANMVFLRFQDALASERWEEALTFCSERVKAKSAEWPSLKEFFDDTMPIEGVLSRDFGCWSCGENFYGMLVQLGGFEKHASTPSKIDTHPEMQWFWALAAEKGGWVVDYPPVKMEEYVANRRAAIQERDERVASIRRELEPKVKQVSTRLTALTNRFVVGGAMPFRLELVNDGPLAVDYHDGVVSHYGLGITDAKGARVPYGDPPSQVQMGGTKIAKGGTTAVLTESIDINRYQAIKKPGKYVVQYDAAGVQVGQPLPFRHEPERRFGEIDVHPRYSHFLPATNTFPSNAIEIEVGP
jgi:hypothetical protein